MILCDALLAPNASTTPILTDANTEQHDLGKRIQDVMSHIYTGHFQPSNIEEIVEHESNRSHTRPLLGFFITK